MKKIQFVAAALTLLGAAGLASCSSEDAPKNPAATGEVTGYMQVKLVNTDGSSISRAESDFEAGTDAENKISTIAFYFFKGDGTPYVMENKNANGTVSNTNMLTPEGSVVSGTAILALGKESGKEGDGWKSTIPAKVVCVANATDLTKYANKNLSALLNEVETFGTVGAEGSFVMTSSTYAKNGENTSTYWSEITSANIASSPEAAKAENKPVQIYIERLAAKVGVTATGQADGKFELATFDITGKNEVMASKKLYAQVTGWGLNATVNKSFGVKNFDVTADLFDGFNLSDNHRSCWATVPTDVVLSKSFKWNDLTGKLAGSTYCYENTLNVTNDGKEITKANVATTNATKVLLQAKIVDEEGNAQELVKWAGNLYTLEAFKVMVAAEGANVAVTSVTDEMVEKVTFERGTATGENAKKVSTVKAKYDGADVPMYSDLRVWNKGLCYYIVNIRHAEKDGKAFYGVVRNHSYKLNITSIAGLGTPGDNGDGDTPTPEPENPDPQSENFVAVTVNILPWHIVGYDVPVES